MKNEIRSVSPVLPVTNVKESMSWYIKNLDFEEIYVNKDEGDLTGETWNYAVLECAGVEIHLGLHDASNKTLSSPTNIYMFVNKLDQLRNRLIESKCDISEIEKMPWGNRECFLTDINENVIVLSQPPSA
jgi:uncharacterized glyoxalase superfamily protein PhnB